MTRKSFARLAALALALSLLLVAGAGRAAEAQLPREPSYEATVHDDRPSPEKTQTRQFTGTRFWLLDPGRYEVEVWWDAKHKRDGSLEGLLQAEVEIGLAPHLQLDLYQNFSTGSGDFGVEGNQIELRYALGRHFNEIPLNPVIYLEWHPRNHAQDRAEARLLLGGDAGERGLWAVNLFGEMNVDGLDGPQSEGRDTEIGATAAFNTAVYRDIVRVGAEIKGGADQHGEPVYHPMLLAGPNVVLLAPRAGLKLTATVFLGIFDRDPRARVLAIAGWAF